MADAVEEYLNSTIEKEYSSSVRNFTAADAPGYSVCRDPDLGSPLNFSADAVEKALPSNE